MKATVSIIAAIAFLASTAAPADPFTPSEKPERWEFIGAYHIGEGAGLESINAVIDPDSITRDGTVAHVYVGRDFTEVNGRWVPTYRNDDGSLGAGSMIASYEIDCKYQTYYELWPDEWIKIEPDSDGALAETKVCRGRAP